MKIRKLQLKNIGVFDDEHIEFKECEFNKDKELKDRKAEIHIFTGQNGSGKTTILQALASAFEYLDNPHEKLETEKNFIENWSGLLQDTKPKNDEEEKLIAPLKSMLWLLENRNKINEVSIHKPKKTGFEKRFRSFEYLGEKEGFSSYSAVIFDGNSKSITYGCQCENTHSFHQDNMMKIYGELVNERNYLPNVKFNTVAFAYSGYRRIRDEKIELGKDTEENPLYQSLNFVKDETSKFTINQWLGRNLSKRALSKEENKNDLTVFDENIKNLEGIIADVIGREIKFKLKTDLSLVIIENQNNSVKELDFDVLPDGLKSLISWIGDLLMRLDSLKWENDTPIFEREIILFLDEIEVHLHPAWQRKVLPVVQKLFKNSQIFVSTHSPFVINSIDDAWVYKLELENGKAKVAEVIKSEDGFSYSHVLSEIFDIEEEFGVEVQKDLEKFKDLRNKILASKNGAGKVQKQFLELAKSLAVQSEELQTIVQFELRQLNKRTGKSLTI